MQGCHKTSVSTPVCWNVCQKNCLSELPSLWITVHLPNCPLVGTSIHLNTGLSEHPSVHMPICQKVCLPERFSVRMCVHVFECPSVKMSFWILICLNIRIYQNIHFSESPSQNICVSEHPSVWMCMNLFQCPSVGMSIFLNLCSSVWTPTVRTSVCLCQHPSVCMLICKNGSLSEHLSICPTNHLSEHLFIFLNVSLFKRLSEPLSMCLIIVFLNVHVSKHLSVGTSVNLLKSVWTSVCLLYQAGLFRTLSGIQAHHPVLRLS